MAVIVKRLANKKTRRETGLDFVVGKLNLQTPFGKGRVREQKPFLPGQEDELNRELDRVQIMMDLYRDHERDVTLLQEILMMVKDNSLTLERSEKSILSVVEIFELKSLLLQMEKLIRISGGGEIKLESGCCDGPDRGTAKVEGMRLPEEYIPEDTSALLDILDPGHDRLNTFYVYDTFSEKLAELRKEKKELEKESRRAKKQRKNEIREQYGINLTPKFDITVSKADDESVKMIQEISGLTKSEEDYMSVTYSLTSTDADEEIARRMDDLTMEIEEEEQVVLQRLSKEISKYKDVIQANCDRIGALDMTLAKAIYAVKTSCTRPEIAQEHVLEFTEGRHLQAEEIIKSHGGTYCPVSLTLKDGVTCITGANMGGKTISLKLTGMVAILAQYGYFVPAESARVGLSNFMQILIGDSQSIERGLSSFGSEMEELKEIMDNGKPRSLLLIDEIASGTNPVEGLALTRSVIDYLKPKEYISLITTHFDAVTYDPDIVHMQVTGLANADFTKLDREIRYANRKERIQVIRKYMDYRLRRVESSQEIPKDALNIAKMLGISKDIIDKAKEYMN